MTLKKLLTIVVTMTVAVSGAAVKGSDECGTEAPNAELFAAAVSMAAKDEKEAAAGVVAAKRATITIPTYVHVIASDKTEAGGYLSETKVKAGITDMNKSYAASGFQFSITDILYKVDTNWAAGNDQSNMKTTLHKGDSKTLNLYLKPVVKSSGGKNVNGVCTLPSKSTKGSKTDGCMVKSSLYSNKQTATHEVGHWLGLFHTFNGEEDDGTGACDPDNDLVSDTPAMKKGWSCDANDDTCPGDKGKDPVNNFMSYGDCRNEFTTGQYKRMGDMYAQFRA